MKSLFSLIAAVMISAFSYAQQLEQIPLIEVEGYSLRMVNPDEAVLMINLEEKAMKVVDASKVLNTKTQKLADELKKAKVRDYKLIADNYSVDINRIYRSGTSRDSGFVARQSLRIVTSSTNEDLQKIIEAINSAGDMSFQLGFQISEATQKSLENTLLTEALKNAESRARLIAETLNIRSIRVHHVSMDTPRPIFPTIKLRATNTMAEQADTLIESDEQRVEKRVYVKYTY
ncbi:SIMPL domain-containing protein [Algoriphagus sp.]|uniref:SIMPL domain-containing protein n=1 Tax=Algoriphagus sp. TaxID=1872435 RepID=UPI00261419CD|nr:SIMPL domain-containing protein [Algoriphagus sp.]